MSIQDSIQSQYLASLEMLRQAVLKCPPELWEGQAYQNKFWNIAYHALFYTHLYLQPSEKDFVPWVKNRPGCSDLSKGEDKPSYPKEDILAYCQVCEEQVAQQVALLQLEDPSGFFWLPFSKLELQFYNIRHLQQHVGELCERLGVSAGIDVEWVSQRPGQVLF